MKFPALAVFALSGAIALVAAACGSSDKSEFGGGPGTADGGGLDDSSFNFQGPVDGAFDPDAFFANDPPPMYCGGDAAGRPPPPVPGGTLDCPDDKRRAGCACKSSEVGKSEPCWPGLRANRSLGVCKDGMTTCTMLSETTQAWSTCKGAVLPTPGAKGAQACRCFSAGQWKIDNLIPCFETYTPSNAVFAVSTVLDAMGKAGCPTVPDAPPPPKPGTKWSTDSLNVDCAGTFTLCYELKAGDYAHPMPGDCSLTKVCTTGDYPVANVETKFPDLDAWTTTAAQNACSAQFASTGGYGEMTVKGKSVACDNIDDGAGNAFVFNRVQYCKQSCLTTPTAPGCENCQQGGSGKF